MCRANDFELTGTSTYTGNNELEGEYETADFFVNDRKCYKSGDNLISWQTDAFSNPGWVIYDREDNPVFYSETETNCPKDAEWIAVGDDASDLVYATGILFDGVGVNPGPGNSQSQGSKKQS